MSNYYLTINHNGVELLRRMQFDDFGAAIAHTSKFYRTRIPGTNAILEFTTEALNGKLARAFAGLTSPDDVKGEENEWGHALAAKQSCAFEFDGSYIFVIETDLGIKDSDDFNTEE